jgi:manganese transport protein
MSNNFLTNNPVTRFFKDIIGPAAIMAAGMIGAGAVSTRLLAGAWFGFDLLWVALVVVLMVLFTNDSASRVGNITGRGMMEMIKTEISPALAWFIFIPTVLLNIVINIAQVSVMFDGAYGFLGLALPEGPTAGRIITTVVLTILSLGIVLFGGFKRLIKVMTGLLMLILVCFIIVAIRGLTQIDTWIELFKSFVPPRMPADLVVVMPEAGGEAVRSSFRQLMSIAGQALPAAVFLSFGYFTSNAEYTAADIKATFRKNVLNFGVIWGLFSVVVVVAGATALHKFYLGTGAAGDLHFSQIDNVAQAGRVLAPALPSIIQPYATRIFSLGLLAAGFTTMVSVAMMMVYFCLDIVGRNWKYTPDNTAFRVLLGLWIAVPAMMSPFWSLPSLIQAILGMAGNLILTPIALAIIIYFMNKTKYVNEFTAGKWRNFWLIVTLLFSLVVVVNGVIKMVGAF